MGSTEWSTETLAGSKSESLLNAVSNRWPLFVDASARDRIVKPLVDALGIQRAENEAEFDRNQEMEYPEDRDPQTDYDVEEGEYEIE